MKPTDSEMEILQILWQSGASSVREINDLLNQKRQVGYTTTLKIIQIMYEKGIVSRDESSRSHIYMPLIKEHETKSSLLKDFIENIYKGSTTDLVLSALGGGSSSKEELGQIKKMIDDIENEN